MFRKSFIATGILLAGIGLYSCGGGGGGTDDTSSGGEFTPTQITSKSDAEVAASSFRTIVQGFVFDFAGINTIGTAEYNPNKRGILKNLINTVVKKVEGGISKTETGTIDCDSGQILANVTKENGVASGTFEYQNCVAGNYRYNGIGDFRITDADEDDDPEQMYMKFRKGFRADVIGTNEYIIWEQDMSFTMDGDLVTGEMTAEDNDRFFMTINGGPIIYYKNGIENERVQFFNLVLWINTYNPTNSDVEWSVKGGISAKDKDCGDKLYNLSFKTIYALRQYNTNPCPHEGKVEINDGQVVLNAYQSVGGTIKLRVEWSQEAIFDDICTKLDDVCTQ